MQLRSVNSSQNKYIFLRVAVQSLVRVSFYGISKLATLENKIVLRANVQQEASPNYI